MRGLFDQLKAACADDWRAYVDHAFVRGMADGTLPEPAFRHYLVQDYLFLIHFARAYALAAYKADELADMRAAAATLNGLLDVEMRLHVTYCAGWGISEAQMVATPEATGTIAYTRFVLDAGMQGDSLDLAAALAPCVVGYGEIGKALQADPATKLDGNPYATWIEMYAGDEYQGIAAAAAAQLDRLGQARLTDARRPKLQHLFRQATRLEAGFWQMGLDIAG